MPTHPTTAETHPAPEVDIGLFKATEVAADAMSQAQPEQQPESTEVQAQEAAQEQPKTPQFVPNTGQDSPDPSKPSYNAGIKSLYAAAVSPEMKADQRAAQELGTGNAAMQRMLDSGLVEPPVVEDTPGDEVTNTEALLAAAGRNGIISERTIEDVKRWANRGEVDPDLSIKATLDKEGNEQRKAIVSKVYERYDESDQRAIEYILEATDEEDLLLRIDRVGEDRTAMDVSTQQGMAIEMVGVLAGVAPDLILTAPLPLAATARISSALVRLGVVATAEAGVAAAERLIRAQNDMTIDGEKEALIAVLATYGFIGAGAGVAAGIRSLMKPRVLREPVPFTGQPLEYSPDSAGAARRKDEVTTPRSTERSTLTSIANKIPDALRSARGLLDSIRQKGTKQGLGSGNAKAGAVLDGIIGSNRQARDAEGNVLARTDSVEDSLEFADAETASLQRTTNSDYLKLATEIPALKKLGVDLATYKGLVTKHRRGVAEELTPNEYLPTGIRDNLSPQQTETLVKALSHTSAAFDSYYSMAGRAMVEVDLLTPEDILTGYTPKVINSEANVDEEKLVDYVLGELLGDVEIDLINGRFPGALGEGEDLVALLKRDPELGKSIIDELDAERIQLRSDKAFEAQAARMDALENARAELSRKLQAKWEAQAKKLEAQLAKATAKGDAKAAAKVKPKLDNVQSRIAQLLEGNVDSVIGKFGTNAQRRAIKDAKVNVSKASREVERSTSGEPVIEEARRIAQNILSSKDVGFVPDNLTSKAGMTQERVFKHRQEFTGLHDELFEVDALKLAQRHARQAMPRIRLHQLYGELRNEGEDIVSTPVRLVREAFQSEIDKAPSSAARAAVVKDMEKAVDLASTSLKVLLGQDRVGLSEAARTFDTVSRVVTMANVGSMLSNLLFSQVTDAAMAVARGGRLGTGLFGLARRGKYKRLENELLNQDQPALVTILRGTDSMGQYAQLTELFNNDTSRIMKLSGLDGTELTARSATGRAAENVANVTANLSGYLGFATQWTNYFRSAMGGDFLTQIVGDMSGYSKLSPKMQAWYGELGIDEVSADALSTFMKTNTINVNGVKLPNLEKLKVEDPDLYRRAVVAFQKAGSEATPSPSLFDKPFMQRSAAGRLLLQFSSWGYAIGAQVIPQLERDIANKSYARLATLSMGGLITATASLHLRSLSSGKHDELMEDLNKPGGMSRHAQKAFMLAPFLPGMAPQLIETMTAVLGPSVNAVVGSDVVATGPARFQRQDVFNLARLLGPTAGQAERLAGAATRVPMAIQAMLEGKDKKAQEDIMKGVYSIYRMTPIINNMPTRILGRTLIQTYGDK